MTGASTLNDGPLTFESARLGAGFARAEPKFRAPNAGKESVRRTGLLARLEAERDCPLVLLTAPAGYGKTMLLAQWAQQWSQGSGRPCAWVTLERADADPRVLADSIAIALDAIGIVPGLGRRFALVLDDAHLVAPQVLKDAVLGILGWLPEGAQLAVGSRCVPALARGRMRAQRMLVELNSEDLSMTASEAASLLAKAGLARSLAAVSTLGERTEGWPAALQLAAIRCAQRPDPAQAVARLSGDDHLISEYFRDELLAGLSPANVRFLMRSSVLERLSGSLCDEVLGCKCAATVLAELAQGNVPLRPLDCSHEWYRLHGLFREMLQTELRRSEPELAGALHRRASDWYRRAGQIDEALEHARSAGDLDRTGELLWANLHGYLGEGRNHIVQRWLSGVTAEGAAGGARLALAAAHSNLTLGRVAAAEQWARCAAVRLSDADAPARSTEPERAGVLLIEAWAARSGAREMGELATRAYELLPHDSSWRANCCFLRGTAALLTASELEAERCLQEGVARGALVAPDAAALCLAQLAVVAAGRDQPVIASDFARRARSVVAKHRLSRTAASALVFAVWAGAAMREGRVDEAKAAVSSCRTLLEAFEDSPAWFGAETRILLARVSIVLGEVAGARELLADASRLARRTPDVAVFGGWFDDAWGQFDQRAEATLAGIASLTTAELRVLRFLPTHYSFQEIAQRLRVSANTVKTHVHAVYRKLDACSRSEAVARANQAGLLGSSVPSGASFDSPALTDQEPSHAGLGSRRAAPAASPRDDLDTLGWP
ncbi:MAG: LuxR C-terminal-related transcriptional regulator [Solirubrobacteraceae bacterium]